MYKTRAFLVVSAGIFMLAPALLASPPAAQASGSGYVFVTQWGSNGGGDGQFSYPYGVAMDAAGNVYVADTDNNRIQKFTSTGTYVTQWGSPGTGKGQFNDPVGVAVDAAGNVYIADAGNHRIQKFALDPTVDVPSTPPSPTFALEGVYPNPARSPDLTVQFDLPTAAPAMLELFDITGRRVADWNVGSLGTGRHSAHFATGARLAPGVYAVRLTQESNHRTARVVIE